MRLMCAPVRTNCGLRRAPRPRMSCGTRGPEGHGARAMARVERCARAVRQRDGTQVRQRSQASRYVRTSVLRCGREGAAASALLQAFAHLCWIPSNGRDAYGRHWTPNRGWPWSERATHEGSFPDALELRAQCSRINRETLAKSEPDRELADTIWEKTLDECRRGLIGPLQRVRDVDLSDVLLVHRFGIAQWKDGVKKCERSMIIAAMRQISLQLRGERHTNIATTQSARQSSACSGV